MASVKYFRLPSEDMEGGPAFDFSSAFTYDERGSYSRKYRSAFTYGNEANSIMFKVPIISTPSSLDRLARVLILVGYMIVYALTFPVMVWFSFKNIPTSHRFLIFRLGHLHKLAGPGIAFLFPLLDRYHKIDVQLKAFSVPPKQIITGDGAIIEVGAEIYFQVVDAEKSVTNVQNLDQSTRILVQTCLCNMLAKKTLADIEVDRRSITDALLTNSNRTSLSWGVEISRAELSQVKVLSGPRQKSAPTFVKPPGLFGSDSSVVPTALAQLANSLAGSQGQDQSQAITQALNSLVAGYLPNMAASPTLTPDADDLPAFLRSSMYGQASSYADKHPNPHIPGNATSSFKLDTSQEALLAETAISYTPTPGTGCLKVEDILCLIQKSLCESVVEKVQESYQFEITGASSGTYYLDLRNGSGAVGSGPDPSFNPAATLTLTLEDLQAMLMGQLKPFQAYMSGRLKVSGDIAAALKLEELAAFVKLSPLSK